MKGMILTAVICAPLIFGCGQRPQDPRSSPSSVRPGPESQPLTSASEATSLEEDDPSPETAESDSGGGYGAYGGYGGYDSNYGSGEIVFVDDVVTNVSVGDEIATLTFTDIDGKETPVSEYIGDKSVVLVITRGNTNPICPYCTTQTSRLISNYQKFADRNAEILVVYPIEHGEDKDRLDSFLTATKKLLDDPSQSVPFPILLDVELKAVDRLGIRKDLSKPATYILDPNGRVRFAYVGANWADRPSIDAMLQHLDEEVRSSQTTPPADDKEPVGKEL